MIDYYYEGKMKELEMWVLCSTICDKKNMVAIRNLLRRHYVYTIDDLRDRNLSELARFRTVGEVRLEFIKEMKLTIEDEEKIQSIMDGDSDVRRLRYDRKLFEKADDLSRAGKSDEKIAEVLGLRIETVRIIT